MRHMNQLAGAPSALRLPADLALPRGDGWRINRKRIERLWRRLQDCTASMRRLLELGWGFAALQQISLSIKMVADTLLWTSATSPILVWLRGVP